MPHLIPNFDDLLEGLNEANIFITLDLACRYLQIPLDEESKPYTAFTTENQTGQFGRAMFGLGNAPRYFAKLMQRILGPARRQGIAYHFFDDIFIYAKDWDQLLINLQKIIDMLRDLLNY